MLFRSRIALALRDSETFFGSGKPCAAGADGAQCGRQILAGGATCEFEATLQIFAPHLQFGALRCCVMALRAAATRIPELPAQYQRYGVEVQIGRESWRESVGQYV